MYEAEMAQSLLKATRCADMNKKIIDKYANTLKGFTMSFIAGDKTIITLVQEIDSLIKDDLDSYMKDPRINAVIIINLVNHILGCSEKVMKEIAKDVMGGEIKV